MSSTSLSRPLRRAAKRLPIVLATALLATTLAVTVVPFGSGPSAASAQESTFYEYASLSKLTQDHADVFRLYWAFFDRQPDLNGAKHWVEQFDQCLTLPEITWSFGNSTEFQNKYGSLSNGDYITLVYRNVMDRFPEAEGYGYWLELLDDGTVSRSEVMLYFSLGQEFRRKRPLPSDGVASRDCTPPTPVTPQVIYANCTEVRNAGAAPLYRDDPGYRSGLDRDNDGVACEVT